MKHNSTPLLACLITLIGMGASAPAQATKPAQMGEAQGWSDKALSLSDVCPNANLKDMSQADARYCAEMGPLETAIRLFGEPEFERWRINVKMDIETEVSPSRNVSRSTIQMGRYNMGPAIYRDLVEAYGAENVDEALNDDTPSDSISFTMTVTQNLEDESKPAQVQFSNASRRVLSHDEAAQRECFLMFMGRASCMELSAPDERPFELGDERPIPKVHAPWETSQSMNAAAAQTRALSYANGWRADIQGADVYIGPEAGDLVEEIGEDTLRRRSLPSEVTIDASVGNDGAVLALSAQIALDDSVREIVTLIPDWINDQGMFTASNGYICARGDVTDGVLTICP